MVMCDESSEASKCTEEHSTAVLLLSTGEHRWWDREGAHISEAIYSNWLLLAFCVCVCVCVTLSNNQIRQHYLYIYLLIYKKSIEITYFTFVRPLQIFFCV